MKILVCGDRNWTDEEKIRKELSKFPVGTVVIDGAARGADSIANKVAMEMGFDTWRFPADWHHSGRSAGPIRNLEMLTRGKPDLVIAFHSKIWESKGTKHMLSIARKAGVETRLMV